MAVTPSMQWDPDVHPEEELWVCQACDAHVHVDSVPPSGCPACGEPHEDEDPSGT